jgi:transcriptional regulator with XRE-family HTH domain
MKRVRDEKLLKEFGFHVRQLRMARNMTLEELAESAGIEYSQVIRVEAGKVNTTISTMQAIALGLKVSLPELIGFEMEA